MSRLVNVKHKGSFKHIEKFFASVDDEDIFRNLSKYGEEGVKALSSATPVDTGKTAASWNYKITKSEGIIKIEWYNTNINHYVNIALILQYGHGTRNGGYYSGVDYINPAMKPVFDKIAEEAWKEVAEA